MSEQVIIERGPLARIRLHRPQALHALDTAMCCAIGDALAQWRGDMGVEAIMIDHAEGRGFCAGGDIRMMARSGAGDGAAARAFFHAEYQMNHQLFVYQKPLIAIMDGVTMGGGAGLALPCRYRIATPNTVFAMPETAIGLFPDIGAGWYLSRLSGRTGPFVALTGARLDGAECVALGLATHFLPEEAITPFKAALAADPGAIDRLLNEYAVNPPPARILANRARIDRLFASNRFEDILAALAEDDSDWARKERETLSRKSPQACKIALRLLAEGADETDFADEMRKEYAVACHVVQRPDFIEGVRATLIDKDHAPHWDPADPAHVTDHMLDRIFAPLDPDAQWRPRRM